jgi:hypothetical protein
VREPLRSWNSGQEIYLDGMVIPAGLFLVRQIHFSD